MGWVLIAENEESKEVMRADCQHIKRRAASRAAAINRFVKQISLVILHLRLSMYPARVSKID